MNKTLNIIAASLLYAQQKERIDEDRREVLELVRRDDLPEFEPIPGTVTYHPALTPWAPRNRKERRAKR